MEKLIGMSMDLINERIENLKELFPSIVTEGKVDFDMLRMLLGDEVESAREKYQFTWNGKADSIRIAQTPSTATLRPCKEKSKNWETTENVYIEGDNLEVLKQLQKTYFGKIKMIYIDPPYNTGNDFVYKDDFKDTIENYKEQTGQTQKSNPETSGRFHSDWLNLMYPRLLLARNLLSEEGAIFISIDDNEEENLKRICDEIFGANNYRNKLLVRRRVKSLNAQFADNGLNSFNVGFEYVLVYSKSEKFLFNPIRMEKEQAPEKGSWNVFWSNADRPTMRYELLGFTPTTGQWRWQKDLAEEAVRNYMEFENNYSNSMTLEEYWKETGSKKKFIRRIPNGTGKNGGVQYWVAPNPTTLRTSNWTDIEVSQIAKEFDMPFDNPKSVKLMCELIKSATSGDDIILDFFSGSATTAHATMKMNANDNGRRKYIMVQLPETIDADECLDFQSICDIGEERIRLAGEKIKDEWTPRNNKEDESSKDQSLCTIDIGFKVFSLDSTNINPWENTKELDEQTLFDMTTVFKVDRSKDDILYEIMLKYGIFDQPTSEVNVNGKTMYRVGRRHMIVCLEDEIDDKDIESICELEPRVVVFKEDGFKDDNAKINAEYNLKKAGVEDVKCI